ncbi:MAG: hypothetical protein ACOC2U_04195 [bacterium]
MNEFENMLKTHDWFYSMSGDPKVYRRGKEEWDKIKEAIENFNGEEKEKAKYLFYKYINNYSSGLTDYYKPEYERLKKKFENIP